MAVALEQFVKQLADSGVIAPGKLENFVPPKASPKDARELARELIVRKQLTKYQVQEIYQGRAKSLILGNYTILDKIGAGGMGQVFKAEHRRMHRIVAIKLLPNSAVNSTSGIARFQREAEAAARLTHPNIVAAYDADEANGVHFLAMEYVEGSDLAALVKKDGPLSVSKAVNCLLQASRGLEFAHGEHVVHRDIKPANLLIDKKGTVKILDMGLARLETGLGPAAQAELTGSGTVIGTVDYMAPEQGVSTKTAGARADIYSLGCTLHYLLTGKPIYDGATVTAKLLAHQRHPIPDLCHLNDDVPEQLQAIFSKMVAKKIEDRYRTMSEVVGALEALEASMSRVQSSLSVLDAGDANLEAEALSFLGDIPQSKLHKRKPASQANPSAVESSPGAPPVVAPNSAAEPAGKKWGRGNQKLLLGLAAAACLATALFAVAVLSLGPTTGTLIVRVKQPNVAVQVLKEEGTVEFIQSGVDGKVAIPINPGKHRLKVEKVGFQPFLQDLSIESGGTISVQVTLEPVALAAAWKSPGFEGWLAEVAALPPDKQVESVAKKLQETNPGFDGKESHKIENGVVTELHIVSDLVANVSPVRALPGLLLLDCGGSTEGNHRNGQVRDLSPLRGMKLTNLSISSTQVSDLTPLVGMPLKQLHFAVTSVANLWPLRGIALTDLDCSSTYVADLSPLREAPLARLNCSETNVTDLSPLQGMHLTFLGCANTEVSNLAPLKGMPLTTLRCSRTKVSDLLPLEGMPLAELYCDGTQVSDLSPLRKMSVQRLALTPKNFANGIELVRQIKSLESIGISGDQELLAADEFWKKYDSGDFNSWDTNPASKKWMQEAAALPAEEQVKAVANKLQELNPQYGRQESHKIENGVVTELRVPAQQITDIMPVRALTGLKVLMCMDGVLSDLSSLKGMPLSELNIWNTKVSDLSPLVGMPLTRLNCDATQVADLSPLHAMPLLELRCPLTKVSDLAPLRGMHLQYFDCSKTGVRDLSPLAGMPLTELYCVDDNQVTDLSPLKGMPLKKLSCDATQVSDLSPLKGAPLLELHCPQTLVSDLSPLEGAHLTYLDCNDDPVPELSPLKRMPLTVLLCESSRIHDLSPLAGMPLTNLRCGNTMVSDLSPLKGMSLTELSVWCTRVSDLSPVQGMPLTHLAVDYSSRVSDLSPLKGAMLSILHCDGTQVTDLSPLEAMSLKDLSFTPKSIAKGMEKIRQMASIERIGPLYNRESSPDDFWKKYDAGEFNPCDTNPAFKKWMQDVAASPADNQVGAVANMLMVLNPHFDGKQTNKIENGVVTELHFFSDQVVDISPVRALAGLRGLHCGGGAPGSGILFDLSPLRGMPLTTLKCNWTQVSDLSSLAGMHLSYLDCGDAPVRDLSPLRGAPLTGLRCNGTPVSDLSPLAGMRLTNLYCDATKVSDLSPLKGMSLETVTLSPRNIAKGIDVIRTMKSLGRIGIGWQPQDIFPPDEFWKKYDAGEFK